MEGEETLGFMQIEDLNHKRVGRSDKAGCSEAELIPTSLEKDLEAAVDFPQVVAVQSMGHRRIHISQHVPDMHRGFP